MRYFINRNCTDQISGRLVKVGEDVSDPIVIRNEHGQVFYRCTDMNGCIIEVVSTCVEEFIPAGVSPVYSDKHYFWKPDMRLYIPEDTYDLTSAYFIKKKTIIEDWMDNEDCTYEISLDGVHKYRILKKDAEKVF